MSSKFDHERPESVDKYYTEWLKMWKTLKKPEKTGILSPFPVDNCVDNVDFWVEHAAYMQLYTSRLPGVLQHSVAYAAADSRPEGFPRPQKPIFKTCRAGDFPRNGGRRCREGRPLRKPGPIGRKARLRAVSWALQR